MQGDPRSHGLWERSAPPPPATAPLERGAEAEVAVVGAGFTGLSAALHLADLLEWLPAHQGAFDLVAAADVLNYFGDLRTALAGIAATLRPGGLAAFSLEAGEDGDGGAPFTLGATMRYRHDPGHAAALAAEAGFAVVSRRGVALRTERGAPVAGVLMVLRRGG